MWTEAKVTSTKNNSLFFVENSKFRIQKSKNKEQRTNKIQISITLNFLVP
jgi:hypothetical protein